MDFLSRGVAHRQGFPCPAARSNTRAGGLASAIRGARGAGASRAPVTRSRCGRSRAGQGRSPSPHADHADGRWARCGPGMSRTSLARGDRRFEVSADRRSEPRGEPCRQRRASPPRDAGACGPGVLGRMTRAKPRSSCGCAKSTVSHAAGRGRVSLPPVLLQPRDGGQEGHAVGDVRLVVKV